MQYFRMINYQALWLLWLVPLLAGLFIWALYRRRKLRTRLADANTINYIMPQISGGKRFFKALLLILAAIAIVIALTEPGWNPQPEKVQRKGRDIIVLLDTSRSMLAEDIKPNRLERAKLAINDLLEVVRGDRVGLITFAGRSVIKCPLTQDYGFIRMMLKEINTETTGRGGTLIGDAIRKTIDDVFDDQDRDYKDIILITDGEDQESLPIEAAQKAAQIGVRVFVVGLGNADQGSRIPITDEQGRKTFLQYQRQEVWTKLDSKTLQDIALATPGGKYLPVATGTFDLAEFYQSAIASASQKELESLTAIKYSERFQIFLVLALTLVVAEVMINERKN